MPINHRIVLDNRPQGEATVNNFKMVELPLPELQDGQVLAKGELGATITSASVSEAFRYPLRVDYEAGRFRVVAS